MINIQIPQQDGRTNILYEKFHEKIYFAGTGIWTHDLLTQVFLPQLALLVFEILQRILKPDKLNVATMTRSASLNNIFEVPRIFFIEKKLEKKFESLR